MAADGNIIVRIQGEADLTQAQGELKTLQDRAKSLEKQMADLSRQEQEDAKDLQRTIQERGRLAAALERNAKYYQGLRNQVKQDIAESQRSIATLEKSIKTQNLLGNSTQALRTQLRNIREELSQMEMAGDTSSQAFVDLSVAAAKLQDQMGDTQRQIQILASDTANLDAAMSVGQGVVGTFNAATSAMALLGGESEELEQAFLKVQAAVSILNGVQQVANVLNKDSAANVVIRTALQKLFNKAKQQETLQTAKAAVASGADTAAKTAETTATTAATTATWSLNAALLANPAMLVVAGVLALVAGIVALTKAFDDSAERAEKMNKTLDSSGKQLSQMKSDADYAAKIAQAEGKTEDEVLAQKQKAAEARLKIADLTLKNMQAEYNAARRHNDEMKEALENAKKQQEEAYNDLKSINEERTILLVKTRTDQTKAEEEAIKKSAEERAEAIREAEKELAEINIALMKDGADKEIAEINLNFDRKIAAIKGNSKAEIELRKALEKQRAQEIEKVQKDYADKEFAQQQELAKLRLANDQALAESFGGEYLYQVKEEVLQKTAELEIAAIERSTASEEEKAERILAINTKLTNDLAALKKQQVSEEISAVYGAIQNELQARANQAEEVLANKKSSLKEIQAAEQEAKAARDGMLDAEEAELKARYQNQEMDYNEYQKRLEEINHERIMNEINDEQAKFDRVNEITQQVLSFVGDMANEIFGAISDMINQQLEDLDEYYTTDAEEAKEDANKKYISEKELENKKLALKRKAAAAEKASTLLSIGLNTAAAIMQAIAQFGPPPSPMGIAGIAMATTLGITQLAIAAAKPLPQYAKGRKPGEGEYALVGEKGPEIMYIPGQASIIPNNLIANPAKWAEFGVPQPNIPEQPYVDKSLMEAAILATLGMAIDYDRMGRAIARNIPEQKHVSVNIDRNGINVTDGLESHTYLNRKYTGAWN